MSRAERLARRKTVINVSTEQDRRPEITILELLKAHKGPKVPLVVYRKGKARSLLARGA